jgi:LacI family transcriptional regulator
VSKRPTITDLARVAGVSVATVDRVLNRRHPVREDTAGRVLKAAQDLGFHATELLRHRLREEVPTRTFGFLLQKRTDYFYQMFGTELAAATRASPSVRGRPVVEFMDELAPAAIVEALLKVGPAVDALAVVAVDHPHVSQAIATLRARGVPTFTLLSDLTAEARAGYIGLDSRKAGRTAAWAIARTARAPGPVGVVVGSHRYLGQELCEISFRSYFREYAPDFRLADALVNLEDPRIAHEATLDLLHRRPDLVGIYVAGGGMDGVIRALREEGAQGRVAMVCNELTPVTRAGLIDGVVTLVIATPLPALAARAVDAMARATAAPSPEPPTQILLPFELYIPENI